MHSFNVSNRSYYFTAVDLAVKPLRGSPLRGAISFFSRSCKHLTDLVVVVVVVAAVFVVVVGVVVVVVVVGHEVA